MPDRLSDVRTDSGTLELPTVEDTIAFGERLGEQLRAGDVVVLSGPLGAGKTALTKGIALGMDVEGPVTSPTFARAIADLARGRLAACETNAAAEKMQ